MDRWIVVVEGNHERYKRDGYGTDNQCDTLVITDDLLFVHHWRKIANPTNFQKSSEIMYA